MKMKLQGFITIVGLLLVVATANAATILTEIGRSPFHTPPLTSVAELQAMVQAKEAEVQKGFELAGRPELFQSFMAKVLSGEVDTVDFQKGSYFEWMFYKKKGKGTVKVAKDVTWANEKPFTGFQMTLEHEGMRYVMAVPLGCGNVALASVSEIPVVVAPPPPPPNQAPECAMNVSSTSAFCGEMITVDASGSKDSDGSIASMKIAFVDANGNTVSEQVVENGLVGQVAVPCGTNSLKVMLTDNEGLESAAQECTVDVVGKSRLRFIADVGATAQFDPGYYLFGRGGLEYRFTEQWSVLGLLGGAGHIEGLDGESAFLADILGEYKFGPRYFVDLGIGAWLTDGDDDLETENSQLDLIAAFGARIFGEPEEFNGSLFFEVRSAPDELSDIADYGRFGIGLRLRF